MEPDRNPKLTELLKSWEVQNAPRNLDERVLAIPLTGWRFWIRGHVRIPVPALVVVALLLVVLSALAVREPPRQDAAPAFNLADFQPVDAARVQVIGASDVQ